MVNKVYDKYFGLFLFIVFGTVGARMAHSIHNVNGRKWAYFGLVFSNS